MKRHVPIILSVAVASMLAGQSLAAAARPSPDVDEGRALFLAYSCSACHGTRGSNGNGGPLTGATILPYAAVLHQVRSPRRQMPAYSANALSDAQVQKIYAYLQTIPKSPSPKDIPILNR